MYIKLLIEVWVTMLAKQTLDHSFLHMAPLPIPSLPEDLTSQFTASPSVNVLWLISVGAIVLTAILY